MLTLDPKFAGVAGSPDAIEVNGPDTAGGGIGPAAGVFDGTEPLVCQVWPGGTSPAVAAPPVAWASPFDASVPTLVVSWPVATVALLAPGWWRGRVSLADLSANLAEFRVFVNDGPDASATPPRSALHAYADLKLECPWIEQVAADIDQNGFAAAGAEARDWVEARALASVSARWQPDHSTLPMNPFAFGIGRGIGTVGGWGFGPAPVGHKRSDYATALDSGGLDLTGPNGRLIVKASVHYALSSILRRAIGATNPPVDLLDASKFHAQEAVDTLNQAYVRVGDLPEVRFGTIPPCRLER